MPPKRTTAVRTKASRKDRMKEEQVVHPIVLSSTATSEYKSFQSTISMLYGQTGIGKTTLSHEIPGIYRLATEPPNNPLEFRSTHIPNWPTFKAFIDEMEKKPEFVKTVSMWSIDTIEFLIGKCMSTVCYEWGLTDLSEEGFSRAWGELKEEVVFNLLRLHDLGPGILLISHEREVENKTRALVLSKFTFDLSKSIREAISFLCSIIIRIRYVDKSKKTDELGHMRCLSFIGSEEEDAKDNIGNLRKTYADGVIKFKTEKDAARKILSCFDDSPQKGELKPHKKIKKKKKSKRAR